MFAVLLKNLFKDDVKILYEGTLDDCHVYAQGWYDALINHTSYRKIQDESDGTQIFFHSSLLSEDDFVLWIDESHVEVKVSRKGT